MLYKIPHKRKLLCTAISMSLLPLSGMTLAQEDTRVEEVVVTGTYIRRSEGFAQASSLVQYSAEDLEAEGTLNLGEMVQQMSFVNGASSAIVQMGAQGTDSSSTSVNLRGLGASSTLTLLDGKRLVNENVNAMIPTIAMQRIDIVADGSAALYGSEAVAGVVNFVPYRSYDGLKVETFAEGDSRGDWNQHSGQVLWGGDIGALDVVVAGQFRQSSALGRDQRSLLANSGTNLSSNAPGNWRTPVRDANGQYTGEYQNQPDPNCAPASERTGYSPGKANAPFGMLLGNNCWFDFGDNQSYFNPEEHTKLFGNATWEVNNDLTLSLQGFRTKLWERYHQSMSGGSSRLGELPAVRGEIPGNPFRAVNGNGNPLFGVDANGDGIPDRNPGVDLNNDGWDDYIVSGIADNGVPLKEDVRPRTLRPVNKTHTMPASNAPDGDALNESAEYVSRWTAQADFTVPFVEGWEGMAAWTQNRYELRHMRGSSTSFSAAEQGLNCDVANDRDACYNPFFVVDQADNNSIHVMNAITGSGRKGGSSLNELDTLDMVFNGEISLGAWELPGGAIGAAFGYQFRDDSFTRTPSEVDAAGDNWGRTGQTFVVAGNRSVDAYFAELAIPVLPNLEIEAAVRREEFSTGQASTDPKFGIAYRPTDWLTLRATNGDAFIAPTVQQLLDPFACGRLAQVTDQFTPFAAFIIACGGGNPNLENETAESTQFAVDLAFGDFDLSISWNNTAFQNRIIPTGAEQLMSLDFFNFKKVTGFSGDGTAGNKPTLQQLRDWITHPASDKKIIRDPDDISTIVQVTGLGYLNAEKVEVTSFDIQGNYRFGLGDLGDVGIALQATYIDEFLVQEDATRPVLDGAGKQNNGTLSAPPLPPLKVNLRVSWTLNDHSVVASARYVDDVEYDGPLFPFLDEFANFNRPGNIVETGITAWTDMDLAYTYRGLRTLGGDFSFTLGSRNLFDRMPARAPIGGGYIPELHDIRGRMFYGRMSYEF